MAVLLGLTAFQQYMTLFWRTSLSSLSALVGAVQIVSFEEKTVVSSQQKTPVSFEEERVVSSQQKILASSQ